MTKKYEQISKDTAERLQKEAMLKEKGIEVRQQNITDRLVLKPASLEGKSKKFKRHGS